MKAIRYYGKNQGFRLEDVEIPELDNDYDVIIKVEAAGLCRTDLHILDGEFEHLIKKVPFIMGHENAGIVHSIGKGVNTLKRGDAVLVYPQITCGICYPCRHGDDMRCVNGKFHGLDGTDGGFTQYLKTNYRNIVVIKDKEKLAEYAPLADAGITAYHAVRKVSPILHVTDNILLIGAGGVGQIALQLLKLMGFSNIIVLEKSEQKIEFAERLGAKQTIKYDGDEKVLSEIYKLTPDGIDAVFDFVGDDRTSSLSIRLLKPTGIYSGIGYGGILRISTMELIAKELTILGNLVGTYAELCDLVKICERFNIRIPIRTFPIEQFPQAVDELRKGNVLGRALIKP